MTSKQFTLRVKVLGLKSRALPAAHDRLVHGLPLGELAREHDVDPGQLSRLCSRIAATETCPCCDSPLK